MSNTDDAWEKFGKIDPYYGVLSHECIRQSKFAKDSRADFFLSGEEHVKLVFQTIREHVDPDFSPQLALDFGCGVGRIAIPLAGRVAKIIAADVSEAMLSEAAKNCVEQNVANVKLIKSNDKLDGMPSDIEFIHSFIVFQHIPVSRGLSILKRMLLLLASDGVGALHFTFARRASNLRIFLQRMRDSVPFANGFYNLLLGRRFSYPHMEMNCYEISTIFDALFANGCRDIHVRFSDHNGFIGAMFYFKKRQIAPL
jgi:trans-aconitate methyltransferase